MRVLFELSVFPPESHIALGHLGHPPDDDGSHAVGEDGKEWGSSFRVVGPAQAGGAPQLEEVSKADSAYKGQDSSAVIGGADSDQHTGGDRQYCLSFVHRRPDKGKHSSEKNRKDNPVEHDPQLARLFGQRDA